MIQNKTGKTAFLKSLNVGETGVWYCSNHLADPDMRAFTATACKMPHPATMKISQAKALLVVEGAIPQTVVMVTRLA